MPVKRKANGEETIMRLKAVTYTALLIAVIAVAMSAASIYYTFGKKTTTVATTTVNTSTVGKTLAGINQPLNATTLSVINNAPDSYYELAGEMYLNGTLVDPVGARISGFTMNITNGVVVGNKTSAIYLGSTTCIYCGENRWAMALALAKFGSFKSLYTGYSSLGDGDVPTLYWAKNNLNGSDDIFNNTYSSSYINFISIEDNNPITGGFDLNTLSTIGQRVNASGNAGVKAAFSKIIKLNNFQGTPYTIWGNYVVPGADGIVFGNSTTISAAGLPEITYMTHTQIFQQLKNPNDQFAWAEYAAADVYISGICKSINNTASVCSLPAIQKIESQILG